MSSSLRKSRTLQAHVGPVALLLSCLAVAWPVQSDAPAPELMATLRAPDAVHARVRLDARPTEWLPSRGRECPRRGPYRNFCQGPRRAPLPHGDAAETANLLGLGTKATVSHVLLGAPRAEWIAAVPSVHAPADLLWPVEGGRLWRGFGNVRKGKRRSLPHDGIDIGAPDGTPIRAVNDALVIYADNGIRGYGNLMVLAHADGSVTFYAHCTSLYFFPGQLVERGQVIAEVGHTGIARGPHLHFEYRVRGRARDPIRKLVGREDGHR